MDGGASPNPKIPTASRDVPPAGNAAVHCPLCGGKIVVILFSSSHRHGGRRADICGNNPGCHSGQEKYAGGPQKLSDVGIAPTAPIAPIMEGQDRFDISPKDVAPAAWRPIYDFFEAQTGRAISADEFRTIDALRWERKVDPTWVLWALRQTFNRKRGRPAMPVAYMLSVLKQKVLDDSDLTKPFSEDKK